MFLTALGLALDILGAGILVLADMPRHRNSFAHYFPALSDVERARKRMTTDRGGAEVWEREEDAAYDELLAILERRLGRGIDGPIRSNSVGNGVYTITFGGGVEYRDTPILQNEFSSWVGDWESRYLRIRGFAILLAGFLLQIIGLLF